MQLSPTTMNNKVVEAESFIQKAFFRLRWTFKGSFESHWRKIWWTMQGASFGSQTNVPRLQMTWPHKVRIGNSCILEEDIFFKFDGAWQSGTSIIIQDQVFIGRGCEFNIRQNIIDNNSLIGSGCRFIDHDHGIANLNQPINKQPGLELPIVLEENVWLGVNVVVLKGVTIGSGSVVGAGSVVIKSIPTNEIWAGVPAKKIRDRGQPSASD
jgi:acetyltransferase-like isoleucine patch superfamily enzyme